MLLTHLFFRREGGDVDPQDPPVELKQMVQGWICYLADQFLLGARIPTPPNQCLVMMLIMEVEAVITLFLISKSIIMTFEY